MFSKVISTALVASHFIFLVHASPQPISPQAMTATLNTSQGSVSTNATTPYRFVADYSGPTFFDHFTAYTGSDPTDGHVNYTHLNYAAATSLIGLISHPKTNSTTAYIGVDHTTKSPPGGRNSVRLTSKQNLRVGSLIAIAVTHIPVQYGLWPAIWLSGSTGAWPASGESDILEYVHTTPSNRVTLHTAPGCTVDNATSGAFQGTLLETDCNTDNGSTGCSVAAASSHDAVSNRTLATAGAQFNVQNGGVYVHSWTAAGIAVWLFPPSSLPADLVAGKPEPSTWTQKPLARFSGSGCDFTTAFREMRLVINIDFCGSWAGQAQVWESSGAKGATGADTCEEYVSNNPEAFKESYFEIAGVQVYASD